MAILTSTFPWTPGSIACAPVGRRGETLKPKPKTLTVTLTPVAAKVYYCRIKNVDRPGHVPPSAKLEMLDFDAGHLLAETFSLSLFQPMVKK